MKNRSTAATIPIRLPGDIRAKVKALSKKSRLSDNDIMRMALERGLTAVEKMFDEPKAVAA